MTRQEIIDKLKAGVCEVTFTKVDGTERTMQCTLSEHYLPKATKEDPVSQEKVRNVNEQVIVAYCPDKKAWRSFRVANVTKLDDSLFFWGSL